jgi:endogenous inhibitor of DNA gyrase (YacG/DUF329 family)
MAYKTPTTAPTCPHCGHALTFDEMIFSGAISGEEDLTAIAPACEHAIVKCPVCDKEYAVLGGYTPHYTSAFTLEELE